MDKAVVDYEAGVLAILQNDGRYGSNGTEFTARDTNQRDNLWIASRLSLELEWGRQLLVLLYAPLDVTTGVTLDRDLQFRDRLFESGSAVEHRYLFDGYRASYAYRLGGGQLSMWLGATLQIRNAKVAFAAADGSAYVDESDIGLVPAIKLRLRYQPTPRVYAMVDADGLSTFGLAGDTDGGIYDVGLTWGLPVTRALDLVLRVRLVGGGATVPARDLKNWANFLFVVAGFRLDLAALR